MTIAKKGINNKIKWEMRTHMAGTEYHSLLYRAEFMGKSIHLSKNTMENQRDSDKHKGLFS